MVVKKTCVLIAGMHRCGTSAVAGCYALMGYNPGKTLMPATPDNPKGYFENIKCWQLNEKMLSMLYLSWDSIEEPDEHNIFIEEKIYIQEIEKIIAEDFLHAPDILIKDPRISYLLPYWIEGLKFLDYEIKLILPYRHPSAVCRSLHQRDGFSVEKGAFIYSKYMLEALSNCQELNYCLVNFDDFQHTPLSTLEHIEEKLDIAAPLALESVKDSINSFVESKNSTDESYKELLPSFINSIYQLFKDIERSSEKRLINTRVDEEYRRLTSLINSSTFIDDEFEKYSNELEKDDGQIDYLNELLADLKYNYNNITENISNIVLENNQFQYKSVHQEIGNIKDLLVSHKEKLDEQLNIANEQSRVESDSLIRTQLLDFQHKLHHTTHSLNQHKVELKSLRNSLSNRLGFALTWPLRQIHTFFLFLTTIGKWVWTYFMLIRKEKDAARSYLNFSNLKKLYVSLKTEPALNVYNNVARSLKDKSGVLAPQNKVIVHDGERAAHPVLCHVDETILKDGNVFIRGWALSKHGIEKVELIYEDNVFPLIYEFERQDLAIAYPEYKDSHKGGFFLFENVGNGDNQGIIKITDKSGSTVDIEVTFSEADNFEYVIQHVDMTFLKTELQYPIWSMISRTRESAEEILDYNPLISVVLPTYNIDGLLLNICIQSVVNQTYSNWELCIHDDASTNSETLRVLKEWALKDSRIKVEYGQTNQHISRASNEALKRVKGEFVALLDHDDELYPRAFYEVASAINKHPKMDVIYSDEDKINESGQHIEPHFKPDWSPETLENMMYIGHLLVIRTSIIRKVEGFRAGFEGSQDYDLLLRIAEVTHKFHHIPKVLYHWRMSASSSAGEFENKDYAHVAAEKAITDYFKRKGKKASVRRSSFSGLYEVKNTPRGGKVGIIIPFHNASEMTINCVVSILESSFKNVDIYLISNNSSVEELNIVKAKFRSASNVHILEYNVPFNFSAINNWAVKQIDVEYLIFVNNDIVVKSKDWMERMLEHAENPEIGAVGAKLLYEDDTIQHAGVQMRVGGVAGHGFRNIPDDQPGYCGYAAIYRNCAAVTGACLMVRKKAFDEVGGFNDQHLHVAYNDIDLCLKLLKRGYRNIYTPHAKLYHLESKTRPRTIYDMSREELIQFNYESDYMKNTYPEIFKFGDPYYNVNLTLKHESYSLDI